LRAFLSSKWTKRVVLFACLVPFLLLVLQSFSGNLGINPVETLQHTTGDWALRFLILTLCITPLRKLCHLPELIRFRRMLGLNAFFYVCLHFLTYFGPDQSFLLGGMLEDIAKRPYLTVGFVAFVLLIPLALTSTAGSIRRLWGKTLVAASQAGLSCRDFGSASLRLAGEIEQDQAVHSWKWQSKKATGEAPLAGA
jgi:DMSO/TMAO reductase YedYZ heme-binding membrane subunit